MGRMQSFGMLKHTLYGKNAEFWYVKAYTVWEECRILIC
jgi:hypothetical protein